MISNNTDGLAVLQLLFRPCKYVQEFPGFAPSAAPIYHLMREFAIHQDHTVVTTVDINNECFIASQSTARRIDGDAILHMLY